MYRSTVQQAGDDLVLSVSPELQVQLNLKVGSIVELDIDDRRRVVLSSRPVYTLQELLDQCDPNAPMSEEDIAWERMAPVGREII